MNTLEKAQPEELTACYAIIDAARAFQREQGFTQWTDDYPCLDTIREDIRAGKGFVLRVSGRLAGYLCIDFSGEPAYAQIEGAWHSHEPYAVVHRMGFSQEFRGIGLADSAFALIEDYCAAQGIRYIRIDTDFPNLRMQHILKKNGYVPCGTVIFQGSGKLAFDKKRSALHPISAE